jgi:hypothetical protein
MPPGPPEIPDLNGGGRAARNGVRPRRADKTDSLCFAEAWEDQQVSLEISANRIAAADGRQRAI